MELSAHERSCKHGEFAKAKANTPETGPSQDAIDAARYRFLREAGAMDDITVESGSGVGGVYQLRGEDLDRRVDEARAGKETRPSPSDLVGALQDVVHQDTGAVRAGHAVKAAVPQSYAHSKRDDI
jgi:hypothetical protein